MWTAKARWTLGAEEWSSFALLPASQQTPDEGQDGAGKQMRVALSKRSIGTMRAEGGEDLGRAVVISVGNRQEAAGDIKL